jgi:tRNA pseudouridine32 synthase/23S rRNA pseudouridine746 synthase
LGRSDVIAETDGFIAVDKPAGLPTVPAPTHGESLWRTLEAERGERLWVVHRIDRGTSGVVVFARDPDTHRRLSVSFERGEVRKTYLAFVHGTPPDGPVDAPLHEARRGRMRPADENEHGALPARTDIRVVETWDDESLIEARPRTGRHHQIRVHLKMIGTPLLADPVYAPAATGCAESLEPGRVSLHAHSLEFDGTSITSPLADDLVALRSCLRLNRRRS